MNRKFFRFLSTLMGKKKKKGAEKEPEHESADRIQFRLEKFMEEKEPYFQPRYTIKDLSRDMNIPAYHLSAIINQRIGMNFNDYLNGFRIRYCKQILNINQGRRVNIQQLAIKCGFRNRNTFTSAFKKVTGQTPSEYTKEGK